MGLKASNYLLFAEVFDDEIDFFCLNEEPFPPLAEAELKESLVDLLLPDFVEEEETALPGLVEAEPALPPLPFPLELKRVELDKDPAETLLAVLEDPAETLVAVLEDPMPFAEEVVDFLSLEEEPAFPLPDPLLDLDPPFPLPLLPLVLVFFDDLDPPFPFPFPFPLPVGIVNDSSKLITSTIEPKSSEAIIDEILPKSSASVGEPDLRSSLTALTALTALFRFLRTS
jgi:hypothetical protein